MEHLTQAYYEGLEPEDRRALSAAVGRRVVRGSRVIHLYSDQPTVIVGDIHGDLEALEKVVTEYTRENIIFLGDIVDAKTWPGTRPPNGSIDAVDRVFLAMLERPGRIFYLAGNHEFWSIFPVGPSEFASSMNTLQQQEAALGRTDLRPLYDLYRDIFLQLPFTVVIDNRIICILAGLPECPVTLLEQLQPYLLMFPNADAMPSLQRQKKILLDILWADLKEGAASQLDQIHTMMSGRPVFTRESLLERIRYWGSEVMLRGHDPFLNGNHIYEGSVLTLYTSLSFAGFGSGGRNLAVYYPHRPFSSTYDLEMVKI